MSGEPVFDVLPPATVLSRPPRASTHAWCPICRAIRPTQSVPLAEASHRRRDDWDGDDLKCVPCGTTLLTIYARGEA